MGRIARLGRIGRMLRIVRFQKLTKAARLARLSRMTFDVKRFCRGGAIMLSVRASGAIALRAIEPQSVCTFGDALWWSLVTISTVGYGDITPSTGPGRVVAMVLIVFGIGVYGYVAGLTTDAITHPDDQEDHKEVMAALSTLRSDVDERLARIEALLEERRD